MTPRETRQEKIYRWIHKRRILEAEVKSLKEQNAHLMRQRSDLYAQINAMEYERGKHE